MRFFISYSRADRFYVDHFIPLLLPVYGQGSVWFDEQIPGGVEWWQLILDEIGKCDIFLMLISNDSLTSEYCQKECREALRLNKPILPIVVRPKTDIRGLIADDLKVIVEKINYIDLSQGVKETKAITSLYGSINHMISKLPAQTAPTSVQVVPASDVNSAIAAFFKANSGSNWAAARDALNTIRKFVDIPDFFNVDDYAELIRQQEQRDQQYSVIQMMAQYDSPAKVWAAIQSFEARFPAHDPENLFEKFRPQTLRKALTEDLLPQPFAWCDIPAGSVSLEDSSHLTPAGSKGGVFPVEGFVMAKYPITNAQFKVFLEAEDGYRNPQWWQYSRDGQKWRADNPTPKPTAFPGDDVPRTNVSWYDAVAFCQWLSHKTGEAISLPTEQQWQLAAQSSDNRPYPWGSQFDKSLVNFKSRGPTPVTQYPANASPSGVVDLVGNVLEWCLNEWSTGDPSLNGGTRRVLKGGSWHKTVEDELKATHRMWNYADFRVDNRGFRIVKEPGASDHQRAGESLAALRNSPHPSAPTPVPKPSVTSSFKEVKRRQLEEALAVKIQEYEATSNARRTNLNPGDAPKLQLTMERLEAEIEALEREIAALE